MIVNIVCVTARTVCVCDYLNMCVSVSVRMCVHGGVCVRGDVCVCDCVCSPAMCV